MNYVYDGAFGGEPPVRTTIAAAGGPRQLSGRNRRHRVHLMYRNLSAAGLFFLPLLLNAQDTAAGARFFNAHGCATCHMVAGRGGIVGPDLSNVGTRPPAQIEQQLRTPGVAAAAGRGGRRGTPTSRAVTVRLKTGQTLRGIARNESTFDLQLLDITGKLHLLTKDQIAEISVQPSLMPAVAATDAEMRDLLAYLGTLKGASNQAPPMGAGVTFADVSHPKPGEWPTYHGNPGGNRFSSLDAINTGNVEHLAPKWMFTVPGNRALQVTPIVVDGVMYVTNVNEAWALDARSGREIWHYLRPRTQGLAGDAASGINRGVAILGDRVFMVTDHAHLIALHRLTGQLLWEAEMADYRQNYGATGAPLVVNDLVISGVSGGDEGIRGFLDAYRASTGERVWRFWTVPAPGEPGSETWVGRAAEHGCAATWLTGTYDPAANVLLLAHWQPVSRLQWRRTERRQSLLVFGPRPGPCDRKTEVALPVHSARSSRLGRH